MHYRWPYRGESWKREISQVTSGENMFYLNIFEFLYI